MKSLNDKLKPMIMTLIMLTVPLAGCLSGSDDDPPAPIDIMGCTDNTANNYDPSATSDDGSCTFDNNNGGSDDVMGCMDDSANNYDSAATVDDGSCEFDEDPTNTDFDGIAGFDASSIQC